MKLGCTVTMLKQKCSRRSGLENCCHDKKKKSTSESLKCEGNVDSFFFFDWKGIVHYEFVSRGETANKELYLNVLKRLREALRRKSPGAWTNNAWMLHLDNTPTHASLLIREFLTKHETTVVSQQPYSPDLAPADFFLFPKLKSSLKGRRFQTVEEIEEISIGIFAPSRKTRSRTRSRTGKNVGSGVYREWRGVL